MRLRLIICILILSAIHLSISAGAQQTRPIAKIRPEYEWVRDKGDALIGKDSCLVFCNQLLYQARESDDSYLQCLALHYRVKHYNRLSTGVDNTDYYTQIVENSEDLRRVAKENGHDELLFFGYYDEITYHIAKKMGVSKTIAEVENLEYISLAEEMGIDSVINKKLITAGRIFRFTMSDKVRTIKCLNGSDADVVEYIVNPDSLITKGPLRSLHFPKDAVIGGVIRGSDTIIAVGDTLIKPYDRVAVFALPDAVKDVERFFA